MENDYVMLGVKLLRRDKEFLREIAKERRMNMTDLVRSIVFENLEKQYALDGCDPDGPKNRALLKKLDAML
jgi:hypothetical protein